MNAIRTISFLALLACSTTSHAGFITFDFRSTSQGAGKDLDSKTSGTTQSTSDGVSLTLSAEALVDGISSGLEFNQTSGSFGINVDGSGDATAELDSGLGTESIQFAVTSSSVPLDSLFLSEIKFNLFTAGDEGRLMVGGVDSTFADNDLSNTNVLSVNESISLGQFFTLAHSSGSGFGLESMTFQANTLAVPEPTTWTLIGIASLGAIATRRQGRRAARLLS
ncbi:PEP-CTERM sorting domain-containing protein [Rhodopirellula baltica]